jgi:maltodextrin utilization protein YvdJ
VSTNFWSRAWHQYKLISDSESTTFHQNLLFKLFLTKILLFPLATQALYVATGVVGLSTLFKRHT